MYIHDTSMAAHQMCLMSWALGIGTCFIGSLDRDEAAKVLELESHEFLTTILPLGYPKSIGKSMRMPIEKIISFIE